MQLLEYDDIKTVVRCDEGALAVIESAFSALAAGRVTMPPVQRMDFTSAKGEIDTKAAYIEGEETFVVKMSTGFFNNKHLGLPSGSGVMVVFSARTGQVHSILLDNGYLTDVRTGLAGAVAAKYLAKKSASVVAVIGAGKQAVFQVLALSLVRPVREIRVFARSDDRFQYISDELRGKTSALVKRADSVKSACLAADILVTCTPATDPLITPDCLHPGLHVTAMGSDAEGKNEIHPSCFKQFNSVVCDSKAQSLRLGELQYVAEGDVLPIELGQVVAGKVVARNSDTDITFCDLTGTGAQDAAISGYTLQKFANRSK